MLTELYKLLINNLSMCRLWLTSFSIKVKQLHESNNFVDTDAKSIGNFPVIGFG